MKESAVRKYRERDVLRYFDKKVKALGGEIRKVKWEGRRGAPDKRVMLDPPFWAELKRPGEIVEDYQLREHARMRKHGERVEIINSFEVVDWILAPYEKSVPKRAR